MLLIIIIALLCFMLIICLVNENYAFGWQLVHVTFSLSFLVSWNILEHNFSSFMQLHLLLHKKLLLHLQKLPPPQHYVVILYLVL